MLEIRNTCDMVWAKSQTFKASSLGPSQQQYLITGKWWEKEKTSRNLEENLEPDSIAQSHKKL